MRVDGICFRRPRTGRTSRIKDDSLASEHRRVVIIFKTARGAVCAKTEYSFKTHGGELFFFFLFFFYPRQRLFRFFFFFLSSSDRIVFTVRLLRVRRARSTSRHSNASRRHARGAPSKTYDYNILLSADENVRAVFSRIDYKPQYHACTLSDLAAAPTDRSDPFSPGRNPVGPFALVAHGVSDRTTRDDRSARTGAALGGEVVDEGGAGRTALLRGVRASPSPGRADVSKRPRETGGDATACDGSASGGANLLFRVRFAGHRARRGRDYYSTGV